jgi:RP/EB family microtubule-associated protein
MQKLHLKKNFDIDKVSKCFFHENYDLAIYLKKQYTLRFQGQNKENTSLNGSFEKVLNLSLPEPEKPSEEQIKIEKITAIIQTLGTADNKITQICEVLGI